MKARLAHQRELADAAKALGEWLERAGDHEGKEVPAEIWQRIAEAAARVLAAATALSRPAQSGDES